MPLTSMPSGRMEHHVEYDPYPTQPPPWIPFPPENSRILHGLSKKVQRRIDLAKGTGLAMNVSQCDPRQVT